MKLMLATVAAAALLVGCSSTKMKKSTSGTTATQMSASKTSTASGISESTVTCTKAKKGHTDTRTIMVAVEKHRCVVHYTKFGKTKEIASGKATSKHCDKVQDHIKDGLVKAGYTCQ